MITGKWMTGLALTAFCIIGCEDADYQEYKKAPLNESHTHDHDHGGHEGKHGGHVLELDDAHGFHAEMVFDSASRDITLYFYGSEIGVATAASGLEFEIEKGGNEVALESKASPLEGETEETASRYVIAGSQLPENIKSEEQLDGHFHVTLGGKDLVGQFHPHSHDDHGDHAHGDAHGEEKHAHDDEKTEGEKKEDAGHGEENTSEPAPAESTTTPPADEPTAPSGDAPKSE